MIRLQPGKYFGQNVGTRSFGAFSITATRYRPGERLPRHCHQQPYLFVTLSGGMRESALRRDHFCTRGWIVYNEAGESHDDEILDSGAEGLNVELPPDWLERSRRRGDEPIMYQ